MGRVLAQRDLRNHNAEVITRNGMPVAELRPVEPARRRLVPRAEVLRVAQRSAHLDAAAFRRDLDAHIDQRLTS